MGPARKRHAPRTAILDQYEAAFDTGTGSVLAVVLIVLCVTVLTIEHFWRGRRGHARIGSGVIRRPEPAALGRWLVPSLVGLTALVVLALGVPVYSLGHWLAAPGATFDGGCPRRGPGVDDGVWPWPLRWSPALAAFPVALLLRRRQTLFTTSIERLCYLASSLPGVVVGLALVLLAIRWVTGALPERHPARARLRHPLPPRALVSIRTALAQAPSALLESARALGDSPSRAVAAGGRAAGVARHPGRSRPGLHGDHHRADGHPAARPHRHAHAGDRLLVGEQLARLRHRRPVRGRMVLLSAPMTWFLLRQRTVIA